MTVYVDDARIFYRGSRRSHLAADSRAELHAFAASVGVARCWYHRGRDRPHYDVTDEQRTTAIRTGALAVDRKTLAMRARDAAM